jgi:hypothetical protein
LQEKIQALEYRQPTTLLIMLRYRILIAICVVAIIATLLLPRIAQDPLYHQFADQGGLLSVPNAFNVLSNLLFGWFLISKICEVLDAEIYNWLVLVSGHSLKHITAGIGCLVFLRYLHLRRRLHQ